MRNSLVPVFFMLFNLFPVVAEPLIILAPYGGLIENNVEVQNELNDSGGIFGFYTQLIEADKYQVNDFIYTAPDVNDSFVFGNHFIADIYPVSLPIGKSVLGAGHELVSINLDTESEGTRVEMEQLVSIPYIRAGQYISFGSGITLTFLPWTGIGYQTITGDVTIDPPGPFPPADETEIDDSSFLWLAGLNGRLSLYRVVDMILKYNFHYNIEETKISNNFSIEIYGYLSRNFGLSYRMKYTEFSENDYNLFNIFGVILML